MAAGEDFSNKIPELIETLRPIVGLIISNFWVHQGRNSLHFKYYYFWEKTPFKACLKR
jgi:hypothetical protein